jgi:hypothetical protein
MALLIKQKIKNEFDWLMQMSFQINLCNWSGTADSDAIAG